MESTIGVEFGKYAVTDIDEDDPKVAVDFQIWDTCLKLTSGR